MIFYFNFIGIQQQLKHSLLSLWMQYPFGYPKYQIFSKISCKPNYSVPCNKVLSRKINKIIASNVIDWSFSSWSITSMHIKLKVAKCIQANNKGAIRNSRLHFFTIIFLSNTIKLSIYDGESIQIDKMYNNWPNCFLHQSPSLSNVTAYTTLGSDSCSMLRFEWNVRNDTQSAFTLSLIVTCC